MLSREQFIKAMEFFEVFNKQQTQIVSDMSKYFDGNGLLFTGNDDLYDRYLELLEMTMGLDHRDTDNPIQWWLYEASDNIYGEPNENGICEWIGKAPCKYWDITVDGRFFHIVNTGDLYDFILFSYEQPV